MIGISEIRIEPSIPLWVLFLAVQGLDVLWAPFVLMGVEKVRIVPRFTGSNALDLYYMPYTHSLVAAVVWSCVGALVYQFVVRPSRRRASVIVGLAVLSHWVLDLVVHVPDLALYDNSAKVGFGLWNAPGVAFGFEAVLLLGGIALCLRYLQSRRGTLLFGVVALTIQAYNTFLGPPPASDRAFALTALTAYAAFAVVIWLLEDRRFVATAA